MTDCFVLTFRAVARPSQLSWTALECEATGTLDRVDRATQFTRFDLRVRLTVPTETDRERVRRALEKAERGCLITRSLKGELHLTTDVRAEPAIPCDAARCEGGTVRQATRCATKKPAVAAGKFGQRRPDAASPR